jgi:hypothetical protein
VLICPVRLHGLPLSVICTAELEQRIYTDVECGGAKLLPEL